MLFCSVPQMRERERKVVKCTASWISTGQHETLHLLKRRDQRRHPQSSLALCACGELLWVRAKIGSFNASLEDFARSFWYEVCEVLDHEHTDSDMGLYFLNVSSLCIITIYR